MDEFLGYCVIERADLVAISESVGIWPFQRIEVGAGWKALPARIQTAVLLHEVGHLRKNHQAKRLLNILTAVFARDRFNAMCRAQEFEADAYAKQCGFGEELAALYTALIHTGQDARYPSMDSRIAELRAA